MTEPGSRAEGDVPRQIEVETAQLLAERGTENLSPDVLESYARFIGEYLTALSEDEPSDQARRAAETAASFHDELATRAAADMQAASHKLGKHRQAARDVRRLAGILPVDPLVARSRERDSNP